METMKAGRAVSSGLVSWRTWKVEGGSMMGTILTVSGRGLMIGIGVLDFWYWK